MTYALTRAITATSKKMELSTQLAYAFLYMAYMIRKKHPTMFMPRYSTDWPVVRPMLLRVKAISEKNAPVQPIASAMYFLYATIVLLINEQLQRKRVQIALKMLLFA